MLKKFLLIIFCIMTICSCKKEEGWGFFTLVDFFGNEETVCGLRFKAKGKNGKYVRGVLIGELIEYEAEGKHISFLGWRLMNEDEWEPFILKDKNNGEHTGFMKI